MIGSGARSLSQIQYLQLFLHFQSLLLQKSMWDFQGSDPMFNYRLVNRSTGSTGLCSSQPYSHLPSGSLTLQELFSSLCIIACDVPANARSHLTQLCASCLALDKAKQSSSACSWLPLSEKLRGSLCTWALAVGRAQLCLQLALDAAC